MNKQFELLEFVFESVYVELQYDYYYYYDEISLTFTAGSVCLCGVCNPWFVVVPYVVGAVVVVTEMHCTVVCVACVFAARVTAMLAWVSGEVWLW